MTAGGATGRPDASGGPAREHVPAGAGFLTTSAGLIAGKVVSLGVGFLFWVLAARAADVRDVGVAAGAVSLMMLTTQLGIAGTGSAFILSHQGEQDRRRRLLDTAVTLVLLTSSGAALTALIVVALALGDLRPVATRPLFAACFLLMTVFGTLSILLDQVSVALGRGEQVLVRNLVGGLLTAAPLMVAPAMSWRLQAEQLFALWVLGAAVACAVACVQLFRGLDGYRYRPSLGRPLSGVLLRRGLPNHALTLVDRAPSLVLPVLVTEILSPQANAYWYVAWMMAWAVLVIPVSLGITLMAQVSVPGTLRPDVVRAVRVGALLGLVAAAGVALVAGPVLSVLGPGYHLQGVGPLRVLLLALLPVLVLQVYYSVCRSTDRLREALVTGLLTGVAALLCTAAVAQDHGLTGMAWAWVAVQGGAGVCAAARLARLVPRTASSSTSAPSTPPDAGSAAPSAGQARVPSRKIRA